MDQFKSDPTLIQNNREKHVYLQIKTKTNNFVTNYLYKQHQSIGVGMDWIFQNPI